MTTVLTATDRAVPGLWLRLVEAAGRVLTNWRAASVRRRVADQLAQLDERLLADIGMSRSTILARLQAAETEKRDLPTRAWVVAAPATQPGAANDGGRPTIAAA